MTILGPGKKFFLRVLTVLQDLEEAPVRGRRAEAGGDVALHRPPVDADREGVGAVVDPGRDRGRQLLEVLRGRYVHCASYDVRLRGIVRHLPTRRECPRFR